MGKKYTNEYVLRTGIGLQDVDRLKNSDFFINESSKYINGEISLDELDGIVSSYYKSKEQNEGRSEEADKIAIRIARIISDDFFTFSVGQLISLHRCLFDGVLKNAGKLRTYNFTKKEWVLDGASVIYGDYRELESTLAYDFMQESKFRYQLLSIDEVIEHLSIFVSRLWQIHAFEEGNTRTTAVFFIKYLRKFGFEVTNDVFAKNAWYFRNALVRANYSNIQAGIYEDRTFLVKFLRNLILGEHNELHNRDLRIGEKPVTRPEKRESRVLALLENNPRMNVKELATQIGVSERTVKSILKAMANEKIIKRVNGKRYGYWEILKD